MRQLLGLVSGVVLIGAIFVAPVAAASDAVITAKVEAYISTHPGEWVAIDDYLYRTTGQHITVSSADGKNMTPAQAEAELASARVARAEALLGDVRPLSGIPNFSPQVSIISRSGGGAQIWGSWDFPDTYAGQGDAAAITMSMDNNCLTQSGPQIWTYRTCRTTSTSPSFS
jgi:hypothetical protein